MRGTTMADDYKSFGDRVHIFNCSAAMIESLSEAEMRALHAYKVEFAEILFKLYNTVDPKAADDFVRPLMKQLAE
jgi:hypothetical protein